MDEACLLFLSRTSQSERESKGRERERERARVGCEHWICTFFSLFWMEYCAMDKQSRLSLPLSLSLPLPLFLSCKKSSRELTNTNLFGFVRRFVCLFVCAFCIFVHKFFFRSLSPRLFTCLPFIFCCFIYFVFNYHACETRKL